MRTRRLKKKFAAYFWLPSSAYPKKNRQRLDVMQRPTCTYLHACDIRARAHKPVMAWLAPAGLSVTKAPDHLQSALHGATYRWIFALQSVAAVIVTPCFRALSGTCRHWGRARYDEFASRRQQPSQSSMQLARICTSYAPRLDNGRVPGTHMHVDEA